MEEMEHPLSGVTEFQAFSAVGSSGALAVGAFAATAAPASADPITIPGVARSRFRAFLFLSCRSFRASPTSHRLHRPLPSPVLVSRQFAPQRASWAPRTCTRSRPGRIRLLRSRSVGIQAGRSQPASHELRPGCSRRCRRTVRSSGRRRDLLLRRIAFGHLRR